MDTVRHAIETAAQLRKGAFVGYVPLGFPSRSASVDAAIAIAHNGADVLEVGIPYSDPVMDGTVIQQAGAAALDAGFRLKDVPAMLRDITAATEVPVLVMTYWNPVLQYGVERFADDVLAAGGAGLITPDLVPETATEWLRASTRTSLSRVFLAAPSTANDRLHTITANSTGFVYAASTMGVTGERKQIGQEARQLVQRLRSQHAPTVCVGIGLSTAEHVSAVLDYADGAIVGAALVRALGNSGLEGIADKSAELSSGTRR